MIEDRQEVKECKSGNIDCLRCFQVSIQLNLLCSCIIRRAEIPLSYLHSQKRRDGLTTTVSYGLKVAE
jgi:hypothetical protein